MPRLRHLTTAIVATLAFTSVAHATDFNNMVVFGDSLSDNGNLSLASGATTPTRFTTNPGTVAVENIANSLGFMLTPSVTGGSDYAFGGAGINNNSSAGPIPLLSQQLGMYLTANGGSADAHTLYSVWGGANDIFYATSGAVAQDQIPTMVGAAAAGEVNLLGQLHAAGAKYVLVFNLPDIGKTPSGLAAGASASSSLTSLSLIYNGVLSTGLKQLSAQGLNVIPVDSYTLLTEVINNPQAYGFTNVTDAACGLASTSLQCGPAGSGLPYSYPDGAQDSYVFADGVHPTTAAHRLLSQYVIAELNAPGQQSLLAEAPLASSAAHLRTVRTNALDSLGASDSRLFANVTYGNQDFDATDNSPKASSNNVNLTLGVTAPAGDHVRIGAALGVSRNNADISGNRGGYKLNSVQATGFAFYHVGGGYVGGYVGFAQLDYNDVQRRFQLGAMQRTEAARTDGSQLLSGLMGGYDFHAGSLRTGPFARLEWQKVKVNGFQEFSGDSSAMWFDAQSRFSLQETLGWRLRGDWVVGELTMHPYAEVSWTRDERAGARTVEAGLTGMNGSFAFTGFVPDKSWGNADVGIMTEFSPTTSGWIGYQGHFADSNQKINSFNMGFKINF
ncbi:autotransporter domain-containing protein [Oleiagrimonas soli]|uniref:Outer membrane lipase/esterase n=1 Tax=Oleiagrimonas soli TaxID=1543381 RepID=A0A099CUD5_9GAMM|nr:autotransporter domain-containing protein [Oleiagrimonas soli]KGI76605.1 transporter [Oleiagrimonas soli]MBB6184912.1 outer membrane lipase/esterase [Oleiagrimonas soli]